MSFDFVVPLGTLETLVPMVCSGILLAGTGLFLYMTVIYRSRLYLAMTLCGLLGFLFVGSESLILTVGAMQLNRDLAVQFHRTEHLAGLFFLFSLPLLLVQLLSVGPRWKSVNRILAWIGLGCSVAIAVVAFAVPDLFISMTTPKARWQTHAGDFGRGLEGPLYAARDALLGLVTLYALFCMSWDLAHGAQARRLLAPLIGIAAAIAGAVVDTVYVYTGVNYDFFGGIEFSRFALGISIFLAASMAGLAGRFIETSRDLESAHETIKTSEARYRVLVEGTRDLVFTLSPVLELTEANAAMRGLLGLGEEDSVSFGDLLYRDPNDRGATGEMLREDLALLVTQPESGPTQLKLALKTPPAGEPRELQFRFEALHGAAGPEILGRAVLGDDPLLGYFHRERQTYRIDNYLSVADEMSHRLVRNLVRYMDPHDVSLLRICLREMLVNAIEHGNLAISFEEKTQAQAGNRYFEFVRARQKDARYAARRVTVDSSIDEHKAVYRIEDCGSGFDHKGFLARNLDQMIEHGRGILLARGGFDEVRYSAKGNVVLLVKNLGNGRAEP